MLKSYNEGNIFFCPVQTFLIFICDKYLLIKNFIIMKDQTLGLIRHALTFVGGIIVAKGFIDDVLFQEILGGIMTLVGSVWSVASKKSAA